MKTKKLQLTEAMFLAILEAELPHICATAEAQRVYETVAKEIRLRKNLYAFDAFCESGALPDLAEQTTGTFYSELQNKFGNGSVRLIIDHDEKSVGVEIALKDRTHTGKVRVDATIALEEEVIAPWVPFPFSLPGDPQNVWLLARREDFGPDEAARALEHIAREFWETKRGLKLLKKRVEPTFANFIELVPSSALKDSNLKRHYKVAEVLKVAGGQGACESGIQAVGESAESQQHREKSVGLTAQMYEIRDSVRHLMRDEYHACMFGGRKKIEACMELHSLDALRAMMKLAERGNADGIIAAYVEMVEPSVGAETSEPAE